MANHPLTDVKPGTLRRVQSAASGVEGAYGAVEKLAVASYDFTVDGGAVSTIALTGTTGIPSGAIITSGVIDVTVALTSGGSATIAMQVEAANDILTAVAVASWTTGRKNVLPAKTSGALTAATTVKTTAARDISIVIATAALTAGAFTVYLNYVDPTANY